MIIDTEIDVAHIELIKTFIKANDLVGIVITEVPHEIRDRFHMCLRLESTFGDTSMTLTFMGVRHCGVKTMLDDYLLKCGIQLDAIQPKSMHRQLQEEREGEINKNFLSILYNETHPAA